MTHSVLQIKKKAFLEMRLLFIYLLSSASLRFICIYGHFRSLINESKRCINVTIKMHALKNKSTKYND